MFLGSNGYNNQKFDSNDHCLVEFLTKLYNP